jgi:hypothetical protein
MGHGFKAIKDYGGITLYRTKNPAAPSMPNSAVDAGVVDFILLIIPEKLLEVTQIINIPTSIDQNLPMMKKYLDKLMQYYIRKGTDFTYYKQTTIHLEEFFVEWPLTK